MVNQPINQCDKKQTKRGLYWFRNDLRLHDNQALKVMCESVNEITFIYIFDEKLLNTDKMGLSRIGAHRLRFLKQSLWDLSNNLLKLGHKLHIYSGDPVSCVASLVDSEFFTHVGMSVHNGWYEHCEEDELRKKLSAVEFVAKETFGLFNENDLPFSINSMPDVFSPFRRKIEKASTPRTVCEIPQHFPLSYTPKHLPTQLPEVFDDITTSNTFSYEEGKFIGGETAALAHLQNYLFEWQAASSYKETRNALDTWRHSTKLSAWLANGSLSAREVVRQVTHFEQTVEKNDSTYWIYFELLWREFFYWLQRKYHSQWFAFSGIQNRAPNTRHDQETFEKWCNGTTGYPIVDACMRQLLHTGYMSNRGRQLVASCFVHELGLDWRYGAEWFEQQLVDYDVGSNWGNWLYLAGVGSDPRGHRQFNLQKQTEIYDADGSFRTKWLKLT